ncbi:glycosyltransferase [bacterium]|nr:glycosyltransferase [bacterium]
MKLNHEPARDRPVTPVGRDTMHLLIVIEQADLPSSRIRFVQIKPLLEELGAVVEIQTYPQHRRGLIRLLGQMKRADLVILQKKLPNPLESLLFKWFSKRLVYDYDDAVNMRHLPRNGSYRSRSREVRFNAIIACADAVICGNDFLAGLVRSSRPVHIFPSPVPTAVPVRDYRNQGGKTRLGWVGLGSNLNSLEKIIPAVQRLSREMAVELVIISDQGLNIDGVTVEHRVWSLAAQEKWISQLDIGIMPLDPDSPYDQGKCSYKLLQYMAAGVIPIADAVGMNKTVIRDGINGRLVSDGDWYAVLKELTTLEPLEKVKMGQNARETVLADYDYPGQAERLFRFLHRVVSGQCSLTGKAEAGKSEPLR